MNNECCNHNCNQGRDCPLRKKELTDEEIKEVLAEYYLYNDRIYDFARAILKKASEK